MDRAMAFTKNFCANQDCPKHTTYSGGEMVYSVERRAFFCKDCFHIPAVFNSGKNLWEFTTTHFNGEQIHVKSLAHLRQLERQYGCSNHAANNMESRWNEPPATRQAPMPRQLAEMIQGR
jgi:hypothetical protein